MTTIDALINSVNYPLSREQVEPICIKRGLILDDDLSADIANSSAYELAYADILRFVVTMVNLSQGGSVSQASVGELRGTANAIYRKYGEASIGVVEDECAKVTIISQDYVDI